MSPAASSLLCITLCKSKDYIIWFLCVRGTHVQGRQQQTILCNVILAIKMFLNTDEPRCIFIAMHHTCVSLSTVSFPYGIIGFRILLYVINNKLQKFSRQRDRGTT